MTEVITLHYRDADEIIPVIQTMLGEHGTVTALQKHIVVRSSPRELAQIRALVQRLDSAPRQLLITVRHDGGFNDGETAARLSGRAGIGEDVTLTLADDTADSRGIVVEGDARIFSSRGATQDRRTQTLRVLEGNAAFIQTGSLLPYRQRGVAVSGGGAVVVDELRYRDISSGFYVVPRIDGRRFTLNISPQRETLNTAGVIDAQRLGTVVSGNLGEWIEIGGAASQDQNQTHGAVYSTHTTNSAQRSIWIRVEDVP
ncbi:MAG: secretin N-terminal domain-containing protein [Burkholderiales bacterium]